MIYERFHNITFIFASKDRFLKDTLQQYDDQLDKCRDLFLNKTKDYGTSWRILRPKSLTDQIFIKAARIRSIDEKGTSKVEEPADDAFRAMVNYGIMALIQLDIPVDDVMNVELDYDIAESNYKKYASVVRELMLAKNHDYGEAWRDMRVSSMTDLILMKLLRIKQIEENNGNTIVSEGLDSNYMDIINYAMFCLIKISEQEIEKSE